LRFIVPLDTCGSWDGGPAAPPLVGPGCNWQALLYKEVHSVLPFLRNFFRSSHLKAFYRWRFERRAVVKIAEIVIVLWSDGCKQLLKVWFKNRRAKCRRQLKLQQTEDTVKNIEHTSEKQGQSYSALLA